MSIAAAAALGQQALESIFHTRPRPGAAAPGDAGTATSAAPPKHHHHKGGGGLTNDVAKLASDLLGTLGIGAADDDATTGAGAGTGITSQQASSAYAGSARLAA